MIASTLSVDPLEDVAAHSGFFQRYTPKDRKVAESFVSRAEAAGFKGIVVTLDTWQLGWRPRDLRLGNFPQLQGHCLANCFSDPVFRAKLAKPPEEDVRAAALVWASEFADPTLNWDDLAWLRSMTDLPLLLKGICHPDDAGRAIDGGVDGIYYSNHGGRQANGGIPAIELLPAVAEAAGSTPVIFDSGVRGGEHIVKPLALGATTPGSEDEDGHAGADTSGRRGGPPACGARVVLDELGLVAEWSPEARELLGYRSEEVLGRPVAALLAREQPVSEDATAGATVAAQHQDGHRLNVRARVSALLGEDGTVRGCVLLDPAEGADAEMVDAALLTALLTESPLGVQVLDREQGPSASAGGGRYPDRRRRLLGKLRCSTNRITAIRPGRPRSSPRLSVRLERAHCFGSMALGPTSFPVRILYSTCRKSSSEFPGEIMLPSHPRKNAAGTEIRTGVWNGYQLKLTSGHSAYSVPETVGEQSVIMVQSSSPP